MANAMFPFSFAKRTENTNKMRIKKDNNTNINTTSNSSTTGGSTQMPNRTGRSRQQRQHVNNSRSSSSSTSSTKKEQSEDSSGYNSGDESKRAQSFNRAREQKFEEELYRIKKLKIKKMKEDGNCLFRAVADQVYGDEEMHDVVRKQTTDFMEKEKQHYSQFVAEDFDSYVQRKRKSRCFGNNLEIQVMSELYNRPFEVYQYSAEPINIFHTTYSKDSIPIRVSYHNNQHYNSVIDPYMPTAGYGLGLPQLSPGHADKSLVEDAIKISEEEELQKLIEQQILEESAKSNWEIDENDDLHITEKEIEGAVLAASREEYWASILKNVAKGAGNEDSKE